MIEFALRRMPTTRSIRVTFALLLTLLAAPLPASFTYDLRFAFADAGSSIAGENGPWIGEATRGAGSLADDA